MRYYITGASQTQADALIAATGGHAAQLVTTIGLTQEALDALAGLPEGSPVRYDGQNIQIDGDAFHVAIAAESNLVEEFLREQAAKKAPEIGPGTCEWCDKESPETWEGFTLSDEYEWKSGHIVRHLSDEELAGRQKTRLCRGCWHDDDTCL
jgi:hypothetical protein